MTNKGLPFLRECLEQILRKHPTPFHLYDERVIFGSARNLLRLFAWNPGFKQFFAMKATPNPFILKILEHAGDFDKMERIYRQYFTAVREPARVTVQAASPIRGIDIEIEATTVLPG